MPMKRSGNPVGAFLAITTICFSITGCGNPDAGITRNETQASKIAKVGVDATSVAPSNLITESSPAVSDSKLPSAEASPTVVCQRFLELLQTGNRLSAENLLTRTALTVTGRAELKLEPLGGPTAKYQLSEPLYATNKEELAQVECKILENIDGENSESAITWIVRKRSEGWRISGMMVQIDDRLPPDLLSFENYEDVMKIKGAVAGDENPAERQADASAANLK
jgi:hypothetical protein